MARESSRDYYRSSTVQLMKFVSAAEGLSASAEETNAVSEQMAGAIDDIASGATKSAHDTEDVTKTVDYLSEQIIGIQEKAGIMTGIATEAEEVNKKWTQPSQSAPIIIRRLEDESAIDGGCGW